MKFKPDKFNKNFNKINIITLKNTITPYITIDTRQI